MEGAIVKANYDWNQAYYGKAASPSDIIVRKAVSNPGATELLNTIRQSVK